MTLHKIDAVLPLTWRDYERSEILLRSLDRFFGDLGTCWVVTPDRELDIIRSRIPGGRYQVIPESSIIPELKFYKWVRRIPGWYLQQLIKLAINTKIDSKFYLTLDSDVVCTREIIAADLVQDGRALSVRYKSHIHRKWYLRAERVLGLPRSGWVHGVTPALLSKEAVERLQDYLSHRVHPVLRSLERLVTEQALLQDVLGSWRSYLLRNLPWTEYALYHTFLEANGLFEEYHFESKRQRMYGPSVWCREDFLSWDPDKTFSGELDFLFVVVQSFAADVSEVWERVGKFIGARDPYVPSVDSRSS